jgi:uncharacterized protein YecA (UPF0149 family)
MKFIHTADLHLDSKMVELSSEKRKIRREEILHTFEKLCYFAESEGVSAVIIAGDMFEEMTESIKMQTAKTLLNIMPTNIIIRREAPKDMVEGQKRMPSPSMPAASESVYGKAATPEKNSSTPYVKPKSEQVGRNDPCPCGSGKKYKKCCGAGNGEDN